METNNEMKWVDDQMAVLQPAWCADVEQGRELLEARMRRRAPVRLWIPAAAAVALCFAFALPQTRAVAQQLWNHFVLNRVEVVRVDFSDLPLDSHVSMSGLTVAHDLEDAERMAGFRPFVPLSDALSGTPSLAVMKKFEINQTIHVDQWRAAVRKSHVRDVTVPSEWEGAELRYSVGPIVNLGYKGDVGILQAKPIEFAVPAGFPLQRFAEVAFRCLGLSERDAAAMAQKFTANPAWLLDIPSDEVADVEQIVLRSGPAMLVQDFNDDGSAGRVTVLRSTPDRIFAVETNNRQQALEIGDALP
ncbi:MAG TPA: hypothetical protein VHC90_24485 [Bryobacteraceae bacterium]|nr:hypothetical protein [Bryobacteraceae bacterium]